MKDNKKYNMSDTWPGLDTETAIGCIDSGAGFKGFTSENPGFDVCLRFEKYLQDAEEYARKGDEKEAVSCLEKAENMMNVIESFDIVENISKFRKNYMTKIGEIYGTLFNLTDNKEFCNKILASYRQADPWGFLDKF